MITTFCPSDVVQVRFYCRGCKKYCQNPVHVLSVKWRCSRCNGVLEPEVAVRQNSVRVVKEQGNYVFIPDVAIDDNGNAAA